MNNKLPERLHGVSENPQMLHDAALFSIKLYAKQVGIPLFEDENYIKIPKDKVAS